MVIKDKMLMAILKSFFLRKRDISKLSYILLKIIINYQKIDGLFVMKKISTDFRRQVYLNISLGV